jgi:AMP deaminase
MNINEKKKYIKTEYRLSIYGKSKSEWDDLAKWHFSSNLKSDSNKWYFINNIRMIQVPRIYQVLKITKSIQNFEDIMISIILF